MFEHAIDLHARASSPMMNSSRGPDGSTTARRGMFSTALYLPLPSNPARMVLATAP